MKCVRKRESNLRCFFMYKHGGHESPPSPSVKRVINNFCTNLSGRLWLCLSPGIEMSISKSRTVF